MAGADTYEEEKEISTQARPVWTDQGTAWEVLIQDKGELGQNVKIIECQVWSQHQLGI
jgi:hypothetical protein